MKTPLPRPPKGGPSTSGPLAAAALAALLSTGTVNNAGALLAQASVLPLGTVLSAPSYTSAAFPTATLAMAGQRDVASVFPTLALGDAAMDLSAIEARAKELAAQEQAMSRLLAASKKAEADEVKAAKEASAKAAKEEAAGAAAAKKAVAEQAKAASAASA